MGDPADLEAAADIITRNDILNGSIEWGKLESADIITNKELQLIKAYDNKPVQNNLDEFRRCPRDFASLFINIIGGKSGVATLDRTRYGLALIEEILEEERNAFHAFWNCLILGRLSFELCKRREIPSARRVLLAPFLIFSTEANRRLRIN